MWGYLVRDMLLLFQLNLFQLNEEQIHECLLENADF